MTTDLVPTTRTIVGDPDHIAMVLRIQHQRGNLLTDPRTIVPRLLDSGSYAVKVELRSAPEAVKAGVPAERLALRARLRAWDRANPTSGAIAKALAFVLALTALAGGIIVGLIALLSEALSAVAGYAGLGLLAVFVVVALLVGGARSGHTSHADGYGFHWTKCK